MSAQCWHIAWPSISLYVALHMPDPNPNCDFWVFELITGRLVIPAFRDAPTNFVFSSLFRFRARIPCETETDGSIYLSIFIRPITDNLNAIGHAVRQDSETKSSLLNTALDTNKVHWYKSKSENRPRIKTNKHFRGKMDFRIFRMD